MKICRFDYLGGRDRLGIVDGDQIVDVSSALDFLPAVSWPYPAGDPLVANWARLRPAVDKAVAGGARYPLSSVSLRSPIANPGKIIGIARNRKNLSGEQLNFTASANRRQDGDPIDMFIKANTALAGPADGVRLRFPDLRTDPEAELTVIIGRTVNDVAPQHALDAVFGYCIGLDMTLREGKQNMSARKSLDTFALIGPWAVTKDEVSDPDNLSCSLKINGNVVQEANTRDLAFDVRTIVSYLSSFFTLYPGDIIMVGTPVGFEPVRPGDVMDCEFAGIGHMRVSVAADAQAGGK